MSENPPTLPEYERNGPYLTVRQIRFCQNFVETGNRFQSYKDAGFRNKSDNATSQAVRKLLKKPHIRAFIEEIRKDAADVAKLDLAKCLLLVKEVALADCRRLYDERGNMLPPDQWPEDMARLVDGVETDELFEVVKDDGAKGVKKKKLKGYARKLKLPSHLAARIRLLDHFVNAAANGTGSARAPMVIVTGPEDVPAPPLPVDEDAADGPAEG